MIKCLPPTPWAITLCIWLLTACSVTKGPLTQPTVKPIKLEKLVKHLNDNAVNGSYLTLQKVSCQLKGDSGSVTNFKANVSLVRNKEIIIAVSKLGIPLAQIRCTPNEIIFYNRLKKSYTPLSYTLSDSLLNLPINFYMLQNLLLLDFSAALKSALAESDFGIKDNQHCMQFQSPLLAAKRAHVRRAKLIAKGLLPDSVAASLALVKQEICATSVAPFYLTQVSSQINDVDLLLKESFNAYQPVKNKRQVYPRQIELLVLNTITNQQQSVLLNIGKVSFDKSNSTEFKELKGYKLSAIE